MVVKNGVEKRALLRALQEKIAELDHAQANLKSIQTELIKAFM
jgi:phosphoglycerate-specific signal transduction histidine kinase